MAGSAGVMRRLAPKPAIRPLGQKIG